MDGDRSLLSNQASVSIIKLKNKAVRKLLLPQSEGTWLLHKDSYDNAFISIREKGHVFNDAPEDRKSSKDKDLSDFKNYDQTLVSSCLLKKVYDATSMPLKDIQSMAKRPLLLQHNYYHSSPKKRFANSDATTSFSIHLDEQALKDAPLETEKELLIEILADTEKTLRTTMDKKNIIIDTITAKFGGNTLQEAFSSLSGLNKEVALMIISLICPSMRSKVKALAGVPIEKFSTTQAVSYYLKALISSGVAAEEERGVIVVMGNTSVGKTSLVNTFKRYIENS